MPDTGQSVKKRIQYSPKKADDTRDEAHRRVADQANVAFQDHEDRINALLSAISAMVEANGFTGWTPPEWE